MVWLFLFICIYVWGRGPGRVACWANISRLICATRGGRGLPLFRCEALKPMPDDTTPHGHPERTARPCLPLSALRQGQAFAVSHSAAATATPAGSTTPSSIPATARRSSSSCSAGPSWSPRALIVEVKYQPPFWVHAVLWLPLILAPRFAAALDEVAADRAAVPSQGGGRPADRPRAEMTGLLATAGEGHRLPPSSRSSWWRSSRSRHRQLQRRAEKHALIAALTERLAAAPEALPSPSQWPALTPAQRRIPPRQFHRHLCAAPMRWSTFRFRRPRRCLRSRHLGISAGTTAGGDTVVVNAGFVQNTMQDRAQQDRAVGRLVTGQPVKTHRLSPLSRSRGRADAGGGHRQTAVVHPGSSGDGADARLGRRRQDCAVLYRSGKPVPESGIPKPGALTVHLKDDHLQYAVTWFALAGVVVIAFGVWWRGRAGRKSRPGQQRN